MHATILKRAHEFEESQEEYMGGLGGKKGKGKMF